MPNSTDVSSSNWEHLKRPLPPVSSIPKCRVISPKITDADIQNTWKTNLLEKVKDVLQLESLDDVIVDNKISGADIRQNATCVGKSGVVQVDKEDDIPYWALSAMTCLANWPNSTDTGLPCYPGFERDVFKAVCDYFCGLDPVTIHNYGTAKKRSTSSKPESSTCSNTQEPLLTYENYDLFTNTICLIQPECQEKGIAALRYALLLLPPANRRKLHLLTRLMSKMCNNPHLEKMGGKDDVKTLVLNKFSNIIMSCNEEVYLDELLAMRLVSFLIDHHSQIFKVPEDLEKQVEDKLARMRRPEVRYDGTCEEIPHMQQVLATRQGAKVRLRQKSRINRGDRNKRKSADLMKSWDKIVTTFKSRPASHAPDNNYDKTERPEHDTYLRMRLRSRRNRGESNSQHLGQKLRTHTSDRIDIPSQKLAASTRYLNVDEESTETPLEDKPGIKPAKSCSDICDMTPQSNLSNKPSEMTSLWNLKMLGKPFSRLRKAKS